MTTRSSSNTAARHARRGRATVLAAGLAAALAAGGGCDLPAGEAGTEAGTVTTFEAAVPPTFVPRRARGGRVTLKAPPTWKETRTTGTVVLNLVTDRPRSSVNLVVVPAAAGETLDKTMSKLPAQLGEEFANFKLLRNDFIILNEMPAGRVVYEASRGGFHGKLMQVFLVKGGNIHILTYTADPEEYDREYAAVEQVLASIAIE